MNDIIISEVTNGWVIDVVPEGGKEQRHVAGSPEEVGRLVTELTSMSGQKSMEYQYPWFGQPMSKEATAAFDDMIYRAATMDAPSLADQEEQGISSLHGYCEEEKAPAQPIAGTWCFFMNNWHVFDGERFMPVAESKEREEAPHGRLVPRENDGSEPCPWEKKAGPAPHKPFAQW